METNPNYTILIHESVQGDIRKVREDNPDIEVQLDVVLQDLQQRPLAGQYRKLRGIKDEAWRGAIRRARVGGSGGYRMVFVVIEENQHVLLTALSPVPREQLDYGKWEWIPITFEIIADYYVYAKFQLWHTLS